MTTSRVPLLVQRGFRALAGFSPKTIEDLLGALSAADPSLSVDDIAGQVASEVPESTKDEVSNFVRVLVSLYRSRQEYGFSVEETVATVSNDISNIDLTSEQQKNVKAQLARFLDIEPLKVTAKAFDVLSAHERLYYGARIFTDMRPVFNDDQTQPPAAIVVVQKLKLTYQENGELRDIYLMMDSSDVVNLREALKRADEKAGSLKRYIEASDATYLGIGNEDHG